MLIKGCKAEDFTDYKKTSMLIITAFCDFKCDRENGVQLCQNWSLSKQKPVDVPIDVLVDQYVGNPITKAVVIAGLEPLYKSYGDVLEFIGKLREKTNDDVVVYTGYREDEVADKIDGLRKFPNVIVKFGRFVPNAKHRFDDVLGVELVSDNQYAVKIS